MTRQLKEMVEKGSASGEEPQGGDSGTLTRRPRPTRSDDSTLKRRHAAVGPYTESTHIVLPACISSQLNICPCTDSCENGSVGARLENVSPTYGHYEAIKRDSYRSSSESGSTGGYGYTSIYDTVRRAPAAIVATEDDLPPPPPPVIDDAMFSSTLSLDSLPPPPPPPLDSMDELAGSQLSLPPPPPEHALETPVGRVFDIVSQLSAQALPVPLAPRPAPSVPRQPSLDSVASAASSLHSDKSRSSCRDSHQNVAYGACLVELQAKKMTNGSPTPPPNPPKERTGSIKKVNFADDLLSCSDKKNKKVGFGPKEPPPSSPRKPPPPKRNESTRLSSPKKLAESNSNPPKEFLKDLQRVMRKKWQVAQKCKLEPTTTPHEVLGFREYPLSEDYKETSVSMWVQEHYGSVAGGGTIEDPFYENVFGRETGAVARPIDPKPIKKRPPPTPPRRSDSTHLSSQAAV